jgi:hypothetical protein
MSAPSSNKKANKTAGSLKETSSFEACHADAEHAQQDYAHSSHGLPRQISSLGPLLRNEVEILPEGVDEIFPAAHRH